ncbi:MAG: tRNA (adenosine(37)-N6)-threonylcarbamoyltransferase complex dimerization subunit type 1 TsaB [Bacteroidota bacterium]
MFKPILSIETSEKLCSAAIMLAEDDFIEFNFQQKNIHSEKLMEMISTLIETSGVKLTDLGHIAVSIGPGSFTGLRIGLSVAKGLAYGSDVPLLPVPNFDALAMQLSNSVKFGSQFIIANRANMNELYVGKYEVLKDYYKQLEEVKLMNSEDFKNSIHENDLVFGNSSLQNSKDIISSPNAFSVAKWSYIFGKDLVTYDHDFLEPNYLKKFIAKVKK